MLDQAIQIFLDERKEQWLKGKISGTTTDEEKEKFERQAAEKFSLPILLPDMAKRAGQLSLSSHPAKYSHPGAKPTPVIAEAEGAIDGFLRTGNVHVELDVLGNAAALDVYKFLSLKMTDGKTILAHLKNKSSFIKEQFQIPAVPFDELEQGLLEIIKDKTSSIKTSDKVKQVYFPVNGEGYHLLSILTPSNIIYELKNRIMNMHFSDDAKEIRAAKNANKPHERNLSEIYGLSVIGYGGTKPQNISVLNSENGGKAYLLLSMPPSLKTQTVRPPKVNFFSDSLWPKLFKDDFQKFHDLLTSDARNIHVRKRIKSVIKSIFYQVADRLWMIRKLESGWSDHDTYQRLAAFQKIWLDQQYQEMRKQDLQWFESVKQGLARWFVNTYPALLTGKALPIGDEHIRHIKAIIEDCEEALQ